MIIAGYRTRGKVLGQKPFECPNCHQLAMTVVQTNQRWFTLFFLPLFPIGAKNYIARCGRCGFTYKMPKERAEAAFAAQQPVQA
jgi:transcription elongation factor Elf1